MSDYISHFGIKGMKWGIRRYQNKDGSLTAEGKARYNQKTIPKRSFSEYKQVKKMQKSWDELYEKEWLKMYNKTVDHVNNVILPNLDKQYNSSDFSKLKFDQNGKLIPGSDPAVEKRYQMYNEKIAEEAGTLLGRNINELYDRIGYRPE